MVLKIFNIRELLLLLSTFTGGGDFAKDGLGMTKKSWINK